MSNHGPVMAWHPETGEPTVYKDHTEVPEGHLPHHPNDQARKSALPAAPAAPAALDMTKKEIAAALEAGGVKYDPRANAAALYAQLTDEVKKALTASEVEFDPNLPTKQLMELLPPAE